MIKKFIPLISILLIAISCKTQSSEPKQDISMIPDSVVQEMMEQKKQVADQMSKAKIEYFIINVPNNQFGYYIMIDGQMYIEQKNIPAVQGLNGFKTKEDAEKVAQRVIEKIKEGEMPPTIEVKDLDSLGIVH